MDPSSSANYLPSLTQVKEMVIARIYIYMQYKYTRHVINFLRDIVKVFDKLPLLP
ncbi:hypothetical protein B0J12DRAFT_587689 [Macrophomina phaseolina]|uniref:Uncharacterized protein n=1 Tax=Macrophomina phaseolina TaxID=35725 RepID=A0ABQ8FP82_9PEZI|nr:hypothetical protein B0J12DRAFT_587689 [Macrophomina phaseolina]